MKKTVILLLAVLLGATACTKFTTEYVYESNVYTMEYQIKPSEWMLDQDADPSFYWVSKDNKYITKEVADGGKGAVVAYVWLIYDHASGAGSWNALPYLYPYHYADNDGDGYVPENFRFDWEEGTVTFVIQDFDGFDPDKMTDNLLFRVCVIK